MGRATKLKALRKTARESTKHLASETYEQKHTITQRKLGECTKGAYRALKAGRVKVVTE